MKRAAMLPLSCLITAALLACGGDEIIIPGSGDIVVTTLTSGSDVDSDGFVVQLDEGREVYTVGTDGSEPIRVTNEMGMEPAWAPDGRRIAFATDRDGDLEIYYFDVAARITAKLTDDSRVDRSPNWSPER